MDLLHNMYVGRTFAPLSASTSSAESEGVSVD